MLYFFKLSVAVVLIVMILVWLCNFMRRGRSQQHEVPEGLRVRVQQPRTFVPPPPYTTQARAQAQMHSHLPFPTQPAPPTQHQAPQPQDDLPPPYHTVVSMPPTGLVPTHLPSYDASCKAVNGPA